MQVTENPAPTGRATGIAEKPTETGRPRIMHYTDAPVMDNQPYVQQNDAGLTPGTMLHATGNFNVEDDHASCVGGQYQRRNHEFERNVLEIRRGDLARFMNKTKHPDLCYGELIRGTPNASQTEELLQKPLTGCFDTRRCVYATSAEERPIPKSGLLGGTTEVPKPPPKPKGPLRAPPVATITPAKRKAPHPNDLTVSEVSNELGEAVNKPDEVVIANMHLRGINRRDFEGMIYPKCGTHWRIKIMRSVDNAIAEMAKNKRARATPDPVEGAQRAPDGVAPE